MLTHRRPSPPHPVRRRPPGALARSRGAALGLLLAALGPALLTLPAAAEEPPPPPPTFLLESIVVEGLEREAARQIVLSESRLSAGLTYSEQELREAVYRVKRLPFVVAANMALRRGSERGAYQLAITVEGATPVFFAIEGFGFYDPDDRDYDQDGDVDWSSHGTVGVRKFVGSRGLLFGSVQGDDQGLETASAQVGYTLYGVFRPGGYASVALSSSVEDFGPDSLQTSTELGIPLQRNQALRLSLAWTRLGFSYSEGEVDQHLEAWNTQLAWIHDTTDDPVVPSAGSRLEARGAYGQTEYRLSAVPEDPGDPPFLLTQRVDNWNLALDARRYWSLTPRQSVALHGLLWHSEYDGVGNTSEDLLGVELLHALDLWDFEKSHRLGDLRLECSVGFDHLRESFTSRAGDFDDEANRYSLRATLLFRNAWGLLRLSLFYNDQLGGA